MCKKCFSDQLILNLILKIGVPPPTFLVPRGGPEKAIPTMNGNWLGDGSSEDPQIHVEGNTCSDFFFGSVREMFGFVVFAICFDYLQILTLEPEM